MKKILLLLATAVFLFCGNLNDVIMIEQTYKNIAGFTEDEDIATGFMFNLLCQKPIKVNIEIYPKQCEKNIIHTEIYPGKLKNVVLKPYPTYILLYKPDKNCKMIKKIKVTDSNNNVLISKFDNIFMPPGYSN